ncbi:MAG: sugar ABC transporter permease [Cyanobacteriota bacterium]|nr:sugar ABC transporter permease [Cyanobacteriota bacterium]
MAMAEIGIPLVAAIVGSILLGLWGQYLGRPLWQGSSLGGLAGLGGSLIFMAPLGFCPFAAERSALDQIFGWGLVIIGMAATLIPAGWLIWQDRQKKQGIPAIQQQGIFRSWWAAWLFLLPTLVILVLFLYYPALDTLRLSTLLTFVGAPRSKFVCLNNFTGLVTDDSYLHSVIITFGISTAIIVLGLVSSLLIAILAYQPIRGANLYRTLLIWPYAISPAVAGIIFFILFNPIAGIINYFLKGIIGVEFNWLSDPNLAPWVVIFASVWKQMGYNVLFYIAGLQNLPHDLQEAASLDGASAIRRFLNITVPLLSPITFFLVVTNLTYAFFDIFGTIDLLTAGGPLGSTSVLIYKIYEVGVASGNLGKAAAQSIVLFVVVVGLTILQFRTTEKNVTYGA